MDVSDYIDRRFAGGEQINDIIGSFHIEAPWMLVYLEKISKTSVEELTVEEITELIETWVADRRSLVVGTLMISLYLIISHYFQHQIRVS